MYFVLFICFIVIQRLLELVIAKRHEKWARSQGAIEYGQKHYPYIVMVHTLFIISMIVEYFLKGGNFIYGFLLSFLFLIALKFWVISSLGKYWKTKMLRIPNSVLVKKGPYKLFKHPKFFIVVCEIFVIPMAFNLYLTAIIFTLLNAWMLNVRIREDEKVWAVK